MVVDDVVDQKWVVESTVLGWVERRRECGGGQMYVLECMPYLCEGQGIVVVCVRYGQAVEVPEEEECFLKGEL